MLLRDLTIENFRSFEKYRLSGLARVNLLVGDNNCGKTSVLEAVYLLSSGGDLGAVFNVLDRREDISAPVAVNAAYARQQYNGRSLFLTTPASESGESSFRFHLSGNCGQTAVLPGLSLIAELKLALNNVAVSGDVPLDVARSPHFLLRSANAAKTRLEFVQTDRRGWFSPPWVGQGAQLRREDEPLFFLTNRRIPTEGLTELWKQMVSQGRETILQQAMQTISPEFEGIPLVVGRGEYRSEVFVDQGSRRVPLSQMGDGLISLLEIGSVLASTASGTALIDEIDTGIHYSHLTDMWRMVLRVARELDLQVFATTHSLDCMRALDDALQRDEESNPDVALFSIDRQMDEAVRFAADELSVIVDQRIEVR